MLGKTGDIDYIEIIRSTIPPSGGERQKGSFGEVDREHARERQPLPNQGLDPNHGTQHDQYELPDGNPLGTIGGIGNRLGCVWVRGGG